LTQTKRKKGLDSCVIMIKTKNEDGKSETGEK
jgi:hypothetical protein